MISVKYASIIAVAAFVSGSFLASPELRAYAANTVGSIDIIDGQVKTVDLGNDAVTSAKIKNGEVKTDDIAASAVGSLRIKDNDVKAQDIAPDAVGASELQGVSKLIFASCSFALPGSTVFVGGLSCSVSGARPGDHVVATLQGDWTKGDTPNLYGALVNSNDIVSVVVMYDTNDIGAQTLPVSVIVYR